MASAIPFDFVFDYLPTGITVKKMFGMHYIYLGKRIMLILRLRDNEPEWNGIWVATSKQHHQSLKNSVPQLATYGFESDERPGNWLMIGDKEEDFEGAAIKLCELITHGDPRIGKATEKPPL